MENLPYIAAGKNRAEFTKSSGSLLLIVFLNKKWTLITYRLRTTVYHLIFQEVFFLLKSMSRKIEQFHSCHTIGFLSVLSTLFSFLQYQKWEKEFLWVKIVNLFAKNFFLNRAIHYRMRNAYSKWSELRMCFKALKVNSRYPILSLTP